MRRPAVRNAVSRSLWSSVSVEKSSPSVKISASGRKKMVVPLSPLSAVPTTAMSPRGSPRANSWR